MDGGAGGAGEGGAAGDVVLEGAPHPVRLSARDNIMNDELRIVMVVDVMVLELRKQKARMA